MGMMIDGCWRSDPEIATLDKGDFIRPASVIRDWVSCDGSSGFKAEKDRYHLYVSYACPWACRTLMMLSLKKLDHIISFSYVDALMGDQGWTFAKESEKTADPLYQFDYLYQIYTKAQPEYTGRVTVPVLWDKQNEQIINNESSEIIRMLNSEFDAFTDINYNFYPKELAAKIDVINEFVYENINNGVYRCGFAKSQALYNKYFDNLFNALNEIEQRLQGQPFLLGEQLTEADIRLFTTLIRFDMVYYGHFKCNQKQIVDYPNLWRYLRELYHWPGIKKTVRFGHIKNHYYGSHLSINPTGIVPKGPEINFDL